MHPRIAEAVAHEGSGGCGSSEPQKQVARKRQNPSIHTHCPLTHTQTEEIDLARSNRADYPRQGHSTYRKEESIIFVETKSNGRLDWRVKASNFICLILVIWKILTLSNFMRNCRYHLDTREKVQIGLGLCKIFRTSQFNLGSQICYSILFWICFSIFI
jgi:hypothetical protein